MDRRRDVGLAVVGILVTVLLVVVISKQSKKISKQSKK